jgi:hypothetical protein
MRLSGATLSGCASPGLSTSTVATRCLATGLACCHRQIADGRETLRWALLLVESCRRRKGVKCRAISVFQLRL